MLSRIFPKLCFLFLLLAHTTVYGQSIDLEQFESMKFRNIGPAGMSGRITAIDVNLADKDIIFVGSASGGVFKSDNGGITWNPLFDDQLNLSIGSIKINQQNPAEIWVGTGEGNPRNSLNTGGGIYKTIDGGKTWKHMGLKDSKVIHRIIINSNNTNEVLLGVTGAPWGDSKERGVYKTVDGGKTWKNVLYVNEKTGVADMVVNPTNPNHIIAAMWEHRRQPWDFVSGGKGSGLYITYDGGDNWKEITDKEGLPKGDLGRMGIAFAPSKPNMVYALIEAKVNGLYGSIDGGEKWNKISEKDIGNRPFYYAELYVDPNNENRIYNLWSYVSRSQDGGKTFKTIMDYGNNVHPDHHSFWIDPDDSNYLINGNDGGLNISRDGGETWRFITNLPVGQFYHVNVDDDFPYNVYGGMQDNGSWAGPGFVLKRGGIRNNDWQELYFGDGFDVSSKPGNSRYGYAMSQGGNIGYYDRETGKTKFIKPVTQDSIELRYNWNAALAQDPFHDCGLYFGSQYVHYSPDCGVTWSVISKDLTTNDTLKQQQDKSGGLTIDATNAENYTTILAIAPSPINKDVVWASTDDGNLQITKDAGKTWTNVASRMTGLPKGSWLPQVEVSKYNEGEAYVVANDYRRNNYAAYAYHTTNYGQTWRRIANDNQIKGFVLSIVQDPKEPNLLFLGTDVGLYVSFDGGNKWTHWTKNFPNVQITDLKIQPTFHDLVIGTFGRSLWILDDIRPLRQIAKEGMSILNKDMVFFEPAPAYLTSNRSYDGIRFVAQGEFIGDNKSSAAVFNYWLKPIAEKTDEKGSEKEEKDIDKVEKGSKDKNKIYITIYDQAGDTIRNFSEKVKDRGFQKIYWRKNMNGVRYPSRGDEKEDDDPAGGGSVLPGIYKVTFEHGDIRDSVSIDVKQDPRAMMELDKLEKIRSARSQFYKDVDLARESFASLQKLKKKIKIVETMMVAEPDTIQDQIKKMNGELNKKISKIEDLFMMPTDVKGIQRNPNTVNAKLGNASYYIGSSWGDIGQNASRSMEIAHDTVVKATDQIKGFLNDDWKNYLMKIKELQLDPLKDSY